MNSNEIGHKLAVATELLLRLPWSHEEEERKFIGNISDCLTRDIQPSPILVCNFAKQMAKGKGLQDTATGRIRNLAAAVTALFPSLFGPIINLSSEPNGVVCDIISHGCVMGIFDGMMVRQWGQEFETQTLSRLSKSFGLGLSSTTGKDCVFLHPLPEKLSGELANLINKFIKQSDEHSVMFFITAFLGQSCDGCYHEGSLQNQIWREIAIKSFAMLPTKMQVSSLKQQYYF